MSSRPRPTRSYRPPAPSTRPTARVPYTSYSAGVPRTSYGVAADTHAYTSYAPYANMPHTSYGPYANMPHTSYGVAANASYQPRSFRQPASRAYGHHTSYNPAEYEYQPRMARTSADTWGGTIMDAGGKVIEYMPWPGHSESLNQTMRDVSVQAAKAAVLVGAGCTAMHAGRRVNLPYMGDAEPHAFDWNK